MTCIIGLEHGGKVYMGGDSAMTDGYHIHQTPYPKVFRRGDYLIGWSSSFRMGQLLEYIWQPPNVSAPGQLSGIVHMVCNVIPSLQACFKDNDFTWDDGLIQIGFQGELFIVYRDWQASRRTCGLTTTGSGYIIGEAAMMALAEHLPPKERILRALEIVGQLADSVGAPYYVMEL